MLSVQCSIYHTSHRSHKSYLMSLMRLVDLRGSFRACENLQNRDNRIEHCIKLQPMNEQNVVLLSLAFYAVLFCAVFVSIIFYSIRRGENDDRTHYRRQISGFIVWVILFVIMAINAFRAPKGQGVQSLFMPRVHESSFDKLCPFLACVLIGVAMVLQLFVLLKARRKLFEQPGLTKNAKHLPPLFWQTCFILLPVAGLAC